MATTQLNMTKIKEEAQKELARRNFADFFIFSWCIYAPLSHQKLIVDTGSQIGIEADKEFSSLMKTCVKPNNTDQVLNQYFKSQWLDLDNHINQTLLNTNYKYNPLAKMYQQVLNDTVSKVLTGF